MALHTNTLSALIHRMGRTMFRANEFFDGNNGLADLGQRLKVVRCNFYAQMVHWYCVSVGDLVVAHVLT